MSASILCCAADVVIVGNALIVESIEKCVPSRLEVCVFISKPNKLLALQAWASQTHS
jgi:hypothetical protein